MRERPYLFLLLLGALALPIFGPDSYLLHNLVSALNVALLAVAWNVLGGFAGQVSFGHAAFFGLGAYGAGIAALKLGLSPWLALAGGSACAVAGAIVAVPTLRLTGAYFALAMLAYAEVLRVLATVLDSITGGASGLLGIPPLTLAAGSLEISFYDKLPNYYLAVLLLLLGASVAWRVRYGPLGMGLAALARDEAAAAAAGVDVRRLKARALVLSAALAGLAGAFDALYVRFLEPSYAFSTGWSIYPLVASLLGGTGTVIGPIAGATGLYLVGELVIKQVLARGYHIVTGALVVLVVLFVPGGLLGLLGDRHATFRPRHRGLVRRAPGVAEREPQPRAGGGAGAHRAKRGG